MSHKVLLPLSEQKGIVFGELLIGDYFRFIGFGGDLMRSDYGEAIADPGGGVVKIALSTEVIKIGYSCEAAAAEAKPLIPTVYVATAEVVDPVTKNTVEVEIRRMESGPMVGFDAAYLEDLASDPAQDYPVSPYSGDPLWVANDEGPGSHAVLIGRHRVPGTTFVEFLMAYDDMSWDTYGIDVPFVTTDEHQFVLWAKTDLLPQPYFANVKQVGVFKVHAPEKEDDNAGDRLPETTEAADTDA